MTQIIYSTEKVQNSEGRKVKNPRHFLAPVEGATKVYIAGRWPSVAEAYEKAGIPVAPIEEMRALPGHVHPKPAPSAMSHAAD